MALILNAAEVASEFPARCAPALYSQGLNHRWANCQGNSPPKFVKTRITDPANKHIRRLANVGDVIAATKFQAYNAYKPIVRHSPKELTVTRGLTTAVIGLPNVLLHASHHKRQMKILGELLGDPHATRDTIRQEDEPLQGLPPYLPGEVPAPQQQQQNEKRAFQREQVRLRRATGHSATGMRLEQRYILYFDRITQRRHRSFALILLPILYFMDQFKGGTHPWAHLLRPITTKVCVQDSPYLRV